VTPVTDRFLGQAEYHRAMSTSVLCTDCPECSSELMVNLGTAHRPFGDNEKMLYRLVCAICGLSYDVHFEDLVLREKPDDAAVNRNRVTTFART
jgi:hypothetical protein